MSSVRALARHGRAVERLSFRAQFFQDMTIAMGPGLVGGQVIAVLPAGMVSHSERFSVLWWLLVPFAVCYWHAAARPVPSPPSGAARRVLTLAASVLTAVLAVAGTAAGLYLAVVHRVSWWDFPVVPLVSAVIPLGAARSAARIGRYASPGGPGD